MNPPFPYMDYNHTGPLCKYNGPVGLQSTYAPNICLQTPFSNVPENAHSKGSNIWINESCGNWEEGGSNIGYVSGCFRVVSNVPKEYFVQYLANTGLVVPPQFGCINDLLLTKRVDGKTGLVETAVICPLSVPISSMLNCQNCLKTLFQCDAKFCSVCPTNPYYTQAGNTFDSFLQCKQAESVFQFDIETGTGRTIPIGVKIVPGCLEILNWALEQCATKCGKVHVDRFPDPARSVVNSFWQYYTGQPAGKLV